MKRIQKSIISFTVAVSTLLFVALPAKAADLECGSLNNVAGVNLCKINSLQGVIDIIANWLIGLLGLVLAVVILYSAVEIVSSAGNPERIKSAKDRLMQAAISIGLLISFRVIIGLFGIA